MNKMNIVFLDDEEDLCDVFKDTYENEFTEVFATTDPDAAIARVRQKKVDLAFFDYHLNVTTGVEVARELGSDIPIVFVTGKVDAPPQGGQIKILTKPFNFDEIESIIEKVRLKGTF